VHHIEKRENKYMIELHKKRDEKARRRRRTPEKENDALLPEE